MDERHDGQTNGDMKAAPRRARSSKKLVVTLAILAMIAVAVVMVRQGLTTTSGPHDMAMAPTSQPALAAREVEYYTCSMHPWIQEDKPGPCPVCGMKLQPKYKQSPTSQTVGHESHSNTVYVSAEEERLLGLRTVVLTDSTLGGSIRTIGRVEVNEERLEHVHTRFDGWIEELYVNTVGQSVKKGDPLFAIYSPEVVTSQEELLLALNARETVGKSGDRTARAYAEGLLSAARDRFRLWEIPDEIVDRIEKTRRVEKSIVMRSYANGYVQTRNVTAGQRIMAGTDLYVIADLAKVWLTADIYERDIERVTVGQRVEATFASLPGRTFEGVVSFIYPYLDETTRTNKMRIEFSNGKLLLKPGMFGEIAIHDPSSDSVLLAPIDAVMITGERSIVFKKVGEGMYAPVDVKLGRQAKDSYEILEGLLEGDEIVQRGNFFLDSESQIRMSGASAGGHSH